MNLSVALDNAILVSATIKQAYSLESVQLLNANQDVTEVASVKSVTSLCNTK